MPRFDVFAPKFRRSPRTPYVISLQSDLLGPSNSVIVGALKRPEGSPRFDRLTPFVVVLGERLLFTPTELITAPVRLLGPPIANLASERDKIIAALDVLFTGL